MKLYKSKRNYQKLKSLKVPISHFLKQKKNIKNKNLSFTKLNLLLLILSYVSVGLCVVLKLLSSEF